MNNIEMEIISKIERAHEHYISLLALGLTRNLAWKLSRASFGLESGVFPTEVPLTSEQKQAIQERWKRHNETKQTG